MINNDANKTADCATIFVHIYVFKRIVLKYFINSPITIAELNASKNANVLRCRKTIKYLIYDRHKIKKDSNTR